MIIFEQNSGMAGMFQVEMHTVDSGGVEICGSRRVVAPWGKNMITNSGLDNMAAAGFMARCMIGAGNNAPAASDTQLQSQLAVITGTVAQGPNSTTEGYNSIVGTYVFGQGVGTGIIGELAVAPASGNITTRALIRDQNGDPTTIVKGPQDVLTVTYQIREYPNQNDVVGSVVNPHTSVEYQFTARTHNGTYPGRLMTWHRFGPVGGGTYDQHQLAADSGSLVPWTGTIPEGGATSKSSALSAAAYVAGSYYRQVQYTFPESRGNGNISRVFTDPTGNDSQDFSQRFQFQASFSPAIDKDNTKTLVITLRKSWGRHP